MATNTFNSPRPWLERNIDLRRINGELVAYALIIILSVVTHLWGLGVMAMHHDESVHAYPTWNLYQGNGGFTCANGDHSAVYCYDPVYHGPSLYFLMLGSFFLFGDGEAQARLPMALAGILLVASCAMLRPYLGRRGALIAAILMAFAPSLLYYTRFARHDALMILWEMWMVVGFLRYLDSGRPRWLYLLAASIALAMATHELYYILFFIFGLFVLIRALDESRWSARLGVGLLAGIALSVVLIVFNPPLPVGQGLRLGGPALLLATALLFGWLARRVWDPTPVLLSRFTRLWREDRRTLWVALGVLVGVYVLLFSSFFAYPRGILDGLYIGLKYWLGSQHDYARGDQPWYYYFMLLPLYEPLALFGSIIGALVLFARRVTLVPQTVLLATHGVEPIVVPEPPLATGTLASASESDVQVGEDEGIHALAQARLDLEDQYIALPDADGEIGATSTLEPAAIAAVTRTRMVPEHPVPLAVLLLVYWFFTSVIAFTWAGEKMPWLLVHMALPGNLFVAWGLGRLLGVRNWIQDWDSQEVSRVQQVVSRIRLVPIMILLLLVAVAVGLWRLSGSGAAQEGQRNLLQGIVPLVLAGGLLYGLLTIGQQLGRRAMFSLAALTLTAVTGVYMLRATWLVVYDHPDTPIEPLIYVQTTPGIPLLVQDIRELAINQTRNERTSKDVTGGLSMPVFIDSELAWPLQWYMRDFQKLNWRSPDDLHKKTGADMFDVTGDNNTPEAAPIVLLYTPDITPEMRQALEQNYVQRYQQSKLNWWFPEGDKCNPETAGYKRFYFNSWTSTALLNEAGPKGCGPGVTPAQFAAPWEPFVYPFRRENWGWVGRYLLYRTLPDPLTLSAREMEVWVRQDLVPSSGSGTAATGGGSSSLRLLAETAFGASGAGDGQFAQPTGIAVAPDGKIYVADTLNHRIQVFAADGTFVRSIGSKGNGNGQFLEPRGIAVDSNGMLYVADTWNARIVKLSPDGQVIKTWGSGSQDLSDGKRATITEGKPDANAANPLGFFGPRGLALDGKGNLFIADTGNKRIVETDTDGNFKFQWGSDGSDLGQFNEPTGVAIDGAGNIYVADTWNGRVQSFHLDADGKVNPVPTVSWPVRDWKPNTYDDPSITASADGHVYVSVPSNQAVLLSDGKGALGLRWGGSGTDLASLDSPSGMTVAPDGKVYVVDRAAGRVLRFQVPALRIGDGQ